LAHAFHHDCVKPSPGGIRSAFMIFPTKKIAHDLIIH